MSIYCLMAFNIHILGSILLFLNDFWTPYYMWSYIVTAAYFIFSDGYIDSYVSGNADAISSNTDEKRRNGRQESKTYRFGNGAQCRQYNRHWWLLN